jgi:hypothetical protein
MNFERPQSKASSIVATLLLVFMAVLAGGAMRHESVTFDEVAHIGAGLSAVQRFDLRMNEEHPPLMKLLTGASLALHGTKADYSNLSWTFSDGFFKQFLGEWVFGDYVIAKWNDPVSTVFWARVPMLLVTLLLGLVLYVYGSRLTDSAGGLLGLCAFVTMPAFLTFGVLVNNDVIVTLLTLVTMWAFAEMWKSPSRGTMLKFGVALGGAIFSKFSAGLLFFCFLAFIVSLRWWRVEGMPTERNELRKWRRSRWGALIKGTLVAALVVYFGYLLFSWGEPTDSYSIIPHFPESPVLRRLLMPVWIFFRGLVTFSVMASRPTFVLGKPYSHGVFFYFPVVFALKTPLALLALLVLAVLAGWVAKARLVQPSPVRQGLELHWRAVWVFFFMLTAACLVSRMTISIRHFLTPLALMILLLTPLPRRLDALQKSSWRPALAGKWLTAALAVVLIVLAVRAYPNFMPFLNSFSAGKPNYELVNDSNMDWNQALPAVETWVQERGLQHILVDEYGFFDPKVYVPQAEFWNCQAPGTSGGGQWAVVSAGSILDAHNCRWLLQYPHEALAGGSMYAFQLPAVIPAAGSVGGPPLPADFRNLAGMQAEQDFGEMFRRMVNDPQQLVVMWDLFQKQFQEQMKKQQKAK